jgi:hypothetical protein
MTTPDYRALCAELTDRLQRAITSVNADSYYGEDRDAVDRARAALAAEPEPPADGDVAELVAWLRLCGDGTYSPEQLLTLWELTGEDRPCLSDEGYARLTRAADLLERLAEPELQGELIPDRYSGYQKTVYRDGFHAGYKHGLTCARAALAAEPEGPSDDELLKLTENISTEYLCKHKSLPSD